MVMLAFPGPPVNAVFVASMVAVIAPLDVEVMDVTVLAKLVALLTAGKDNAAAPDTVIVLSADRPAALVSVKVPLPANVTAVAAVSPQLGIVVVPLLVNAIVVGVLYWT